MGGIGPGGVKRRNQCDPSSSKSGSPSTSTSAEGEVGMEEGKMPPRVRKRWKGLSSASEEKGGDWVWGVGKGVNGAMGDGNRMDVDGDVNGESVFISFRYGV